MVDMKHREETLMWQRFWNTPARE